MSTAYPGGVDVFPTHKPGRSITSAALNNVQDAVVALEQGTVGHGLDIRSFGFQGATHQFVCSIGVGSQYTNCTGAQASDVGHWAIIYGAGPLGTDLVAQVDSVIVGANHHLTVAASTTVGPTLIEIFYADDTLAFSQAVAALQAAGGGRLYIPGSFQITCPLGNGVNGAYLTNVAGTALGRLHDLEGVVIDMPNGTVVDVQTYANPNSYPIYGQFGVLLEVTNVRRAAVNLRVASQYMGTVVTSGTPIACGLLSLYLVGDTQQLRAQIGQAGGVGVYQVVPSGGTPGNPAPTQLDLDTIAYRVEYPCVFAFGGNQSRIRVAGTQCGRNLFLYGVHDVDADVWSYGQQIQTLLKSYNGYGNSNIRLRYYDHSPTVLGTPNSPAAQLWVVHGDSPAATHRNIDLELDLDLTAGGYGDAVAIAKQLPAGGPGDTVGRGHVLDGIRIRGSVKTATSRYALVADPTASGGSYGAYVRTGTPDAITRLDLAGLRVEQGLVLLTLGGTLGDTVNATALTTSQTLGPNDNNQVRRMDVTGGNLTVTLPDATQWIGYRALVKRVDASANTLTPVTVSGQTIDGAAPVAIGARGMFRAISNGTNWDLV